VKGKCNGNRGSFVAALLNDDSAVVGGMCAEGRHRGWIVDDAEVAGFTVGWFGFVLSPVPKCEGPGAPAIVGLPSSVRGKCKSNYGFFPAL